MGKISRRCFRLLVIKIIRQRMMEMKERKRESDDADGDSNRGHIVDD